MTIEEVTKKSNELRSEITRLVAEFEQTTKCSVIDIGIDRMPPTLENAVGRALVELDVRLPLP
jgi:hypothetical protein